jgi:hypothetical protein
LPRKDATRCGPVDDEWMQMQTDLVGLPGWTGGRVKNSSECESHLTLLDSRQNISLTFFLTPCYPYSSSELFVIFSSSLHNFRDSLC